MSSGFHLPGASAGEGLEFKPRQQSEPEINLIPFIDVLLVILIFLLLTTTYSQNLQLRINLPVAQSDKDKAPNPPLPSQQLLRLRQPPPSSSLLRMNWRGSQPRLVRPPKRPRQSVRSMPTSRNSSCNSPRAAQVFLKSSLATCGKPLATRQVHALVPRPLRVNTC